MYCKYIYVKTRYSANIQMSPIVIAFYYTLNSVTSHVPPKRKWRRPYKKLMISITSCGELVMSACLYMRKLVPKFLRYRYI